MDQMANELAQFSQVETWVPLKNMTTLRIGGRAHYVCYPENTVALDSIMKMIEKAGLPYKMFGKGSNLLCSDDDFEGVVIRLDRHFNDFYFKGTTVIAQAGCSIIVLANECMKNGLSGLEFASGIPATVGGTAYMNAGAYKSSMSDVIDSVFIYRNGRFEWIPVSECEYSYRTSVFQKQPDWIIIAVRMQLKQGDPDEIRDLMERRRERRMSSQPLDKPSCGSVFHNPENVPAWKLIEGIGYRGHRVGGAKVSEKHVNFIVNEDHANAEDFLSLVTEIQQKVKEQYGVDLHMEVEKFNWR
ncbi:MAG: UDP-N-acetylmuramate dehydrogenase [Solobacterium sp.]|jgi:UDP-N-acetylmuramate dehydrogenase|nr:UDP-N-acetylmuramate dehydrogenase [Solobacterium sp.]MCH4222428.1 UDP-N-acetylmuramate dehydrogenase [Solobacterium sp.]MCH4265298.1 UDP-N-acetylmuramate dehydrogenase [Solobacterium sp.]